MFKKFHIKHQTHLETLFKFTGLVAILVGYFIFMSWKYDASTGAALTVLTWSFFVICTPVADGGFILAFPIRLLFKLRMLVTQILIWIFAIIFNVVIFFNYRELYQQSFITKLLGRILEQPYPYWSLIVLSAIGTLLSIYFGDEMMDVTAHKDRDKHHKHGMFYRMVIIVSLGVGTIIAYYELLSSLGISLS